MMSNSVLIYILSFDALLLLLLILMIYKILNAHWNPSYPNYLKQSDFFYYGHRGAPTLAPENTLLSFQEAINNNIDGIELDVQLSKDRKLIIYHDEYIDYNGSKSKISNLSLEEIQLIDVKNNFTNLAFQKIPELSEVLEILPSNMILNIEIKSYYSNLFSNGIEDELLKTVKGKVDMQQLIISSFNPFIVKRIKKIDKSLSTALIWSSKSYWWLSVAMIPKYKVFSAYCKPDIFHVNINDVNKKMVNWFQKRNIPLYAYTVNTKSDLDKAQGYELNGIFTDDPTIKNV